MSRGHTPHKDGGILKPNGPRQPGSSHDIQPGDKRANQDLMGRLGVSERDIVPEDQLEEAHSPIKRKNKLGSVINVDADVPDIVEA